MEVKTSKIQVHNGHGSEVKIDTSSSDTEVDVDFDVNGCGSDCGGIDIDQLTESTHVDVGVGVNGVISNAERKESDDFTDFGEYPAKIEKNATLGRYLVASRDIKEGEILLRDEPIFQSPNAGDDGHTCLGCCVKVKQTPNTCSKCGWPVCGVDCENRPEHRDNECSVFSRNSIRPDLPTPFCFVAGAEFIKVLRGLLLSLGRCEKDRRNWKLLQNLEGHIETRNSIPKILFMSTLSRNFIQQMCHLEQEFDSSRIDFILGVIDVNAFRHIIHPNNPMRAKPKEEVRIDRYQKQKTQKQTQSQPELDLNATFLYPKASMAAHGCRRNVRWETMVNGHLEMWAAEDIKKGELLTHPYVDLMQGTPDRRRQLRDQFYFDCSCPRCSDPTELGTYFSALKCPLTDEGCKGGYLLAVNPLDYETSWKCHKCPCVETSEYERDLIEQIKSEVKTVLEMEALGNVSNLAVIGGLARILGKYQGKKVHQNHYVIVNVEYNLVKRMAKVGKSTVDLLHEMRKMIHKFLDISVVFYPGIKEK